MLEFLYILTLQPWNYSQPTNSWSHFVNIFSPRQVAVISTWHLYFVNNIKYRKTTSGDFIYFWAQNKSNHKNSHSNKSIDSLAANSTLNDNNPGNIPISSIALIEAFQTFIIQLSYQSTSKPLPIQSIKILHITLSTQVSTSS